MSYRREREEFIARVTREGLGFHQALALLREATTINRLAELACSSEAADRDRISCPETLDPARGGKMNPERYPCLCDRPGGDEHQDIPRIRLLDFRAEQRASRALPPGWRMITAGDPRGYTLRVIPPSYAERNKGRDVHNLEAIGVPARESRIKW